MTWDEVRTLRVRERLPALRPASAAHDGEGTVLRLEDLLGILDAAPRAVGLVAEVKHATFFDRAGFPMAQLLDDALGDAGWRGDERLTVESFEKTCSGSSARVARVVGSCTSRRPWQRRGRGRPPRVSGSVVGLGTDRRGARRVRRGVSTASASTCGP